MYPLIGIEFQVCVLFYTSCAPPALPRHPKVENHMHFSHVEQKKPISVSPKLIPKLHEELIHFETKWKYNQDYLADESLKEGMF